MSYEVFEKNQKIIIAGEEYIANNRIGEYPDLLGSFNQLAKRNFGISFQAVGGDYEPHVLIQGGTVCANVSVNQISFILQGKKKLYIQLGTVMTHEAHRNRGLSRYLIEEIVNQWKDKCDGLYLFANDTVLQFYPKFGFKKQEEYEYKYEFVLPEESTATEGRLRPLDMKNDESIRLVWQKYCEGNPFSELYMVENEPLFSFYYQGLMKDAIYFMEEFQVVVVVEEEDDIMICYEILGKTDATIGKTDATMAQILSAIAFHGKKQAVILGFTPVMKEGFVCQLHKEEDTTLFVHEDSEDMIEGNQRMFPLLSHA